MAESSNNYEIFSEHTKSIMTIKNEKVIEQPSQTTKSKTHNPTGFESSKEKKDPKLREEPTPPGPSYLPKAPFPSVLKFPISFNGKGGKIDKILELFKKV